MDIFISAGRRHTTPVLNTKQAVKYLRALPWADFVIVGAWKVYCSKARVLGRKKDERGGLTYSSTVAGKNKCDAVLEVMFKDEPRVAALR